jgi:hypothetical protein
MEKLTKKERKFIEELRIGLAEAIAVGCRLPIWLGRAAVGLKTEVPK